MILTQSTGTRRRPAHRPASIWPPAGSCRCGPCSWWCCWWPPCRYSSQICDAPVFPNLAREFLQTESHRPQVSSLYGAKFQILHAGRVGADNVVRRRRQMSRKAKNCALLADISVVLEGVWVGTCSVHATRQFRNERNIHEKTAKFTFY